MKTPSNSLNPATTRTSDITTMINFDPPELQAALQDAIVRLGSAFGVEWQGVELDSELDVDLDEEVTFASGTSLTLSFPRSEVDAELTIRDLIELSLEVTDPASTCDGLTYHSKFRTVVRMKSWDLRSDGFVSRIGSPENEGGKIIGEIEGSPVSVSLLSPSPHFGAAIVVKDHFYDKYNPPLGWDEFFVEVHHPMGATIAGSNALIQAYLFELHVTLGLDFSEAPRPVEFDIEYPEDEEIGDLVERANNMRPLLTGPGLVAVLSEFNSVNGLSMGDAALLAYVKCIEYVSATVVREKQYEDLRKRLLSKDALNPNAEFMDGLLVLFEENRVFTRDAEALRLSIERCCDPLPMKLHSPPILRSLAKIHSSSSSENRNQALVDLAAVLSATRNQLAHAKANYRVMGKECPQEQLQSLVVCARIAAEQCIRWYASRSEELRRS
ncbi:hypothetical protein [Stenotrophomonas sp. CFBP 13718]|uniref:hypothetical protein n=1 Tax=Stenotrophomonas sp. CFBP 13718 TaxID=2775304 RepID=UPI00177BB712|nr:hypothetical protein [Stenotrophomonas sp. CFBP 13718]MBD8696048.1 hypothetical protein [Stenotrophomonas sp. CFBP 13718]